MHTEEEHLTSNDSYRSRYPSVAVSTLVFTTKKDILQVALIKCPEYPYIDRYCLPCTYIRADETADEAALRCLRDRTEITDVSIEQLYTFSDVARNPALRIIMVSYIAMVPECKLSHFKESADLKAVLFDVVRTEDGFYFYSDSEAGEIRLEKSELLFDHAQMIQTALDRMAGKIDYSEIAFRFLNNTERFTLTELRYIYDAVKGIRSDVGNFRRFIKNRYIITGKVVNNTDDRMEMEHAGRPASTFRYIENPAKETE